MPFGIGRALGGLIKVGSAVLPGPVGTIGRALGGVLEGRRGEAANPRPTPVPSVPTFAAPSPSSLSLPGEVAAGIKGALQGGLTGGFPGAVVGGSLGIAQHQLTPAAPMNTAMMTPAGSVYTADIMMPTAATEYRSPKGYRTYTATESSAPLLGVPAGTKVSIKLGTDLARKLKIRSASYNRPKVSAAQARELKRMNRTKDRMYDLAKEAGLYVTKTRPRK